MYHQLWYNHTKESKFLDNLRFHFGSPLKYQATGTGHPSSSNYMTNTCYTQHTCTATGKSKCTMKDMGEEKTSAHQHTTKQLWFSACWFFFFCWQLVYYVCHRTPPPPPPHRTQEKQPTAVSTCSSSTLTPSAWLLACRHPSGTAATIQHSKHSVQFLLTTQQNSRTFQSSETVTHQAAFLTNPS